MGQNSESSEVACTLAEDQIDEREAEIRTELHSNYVEANELEGGFTLVFSCSKQTIESAARFIASELECCSFAEYQLEVVPPYEQTRLTITGPDGTKELFREGLIDQLEAGSQ